MKAVQDIIVSAFEQIDSLTPDSTDQALKEAVTTCIDSMNNGSLRVAEKVGGQWQVNEW